MRNARPLDVLQLVDRRARVVELVELAVDGVERLCGQRRASHVHIVRLSLKLGKERLAEDRGAEALEEVVENVRTLLGILLGSEQIARQQYLVDGGGYLGHENAVVVVGVILLLGGVVGVHRVTQLVRQRKGVVQRVGVVEQDVGMHAVHAAGVCARGLALVLVYVDPALGKGAVKQLLVPLSQRQGGLLDQLLCLLVGDLHLHALHHRAVEIVHIQLVKPQHAAAQLQVAAHDGQASVNGLGQAVVDRYGHVVAEERLLAGRLVSAHAGIKIVHLDATRIHGRQRVDVLLEFSEILLEGVLSDALITALAIDAEVAVRQRDRLARLVNDGREGYVHALEHGEGVLRRACGVREHGQHTLALGVQRVRSLAGDVLQLVAVARENGILQHGGKLLLLDREDLGHEEGTRGGKLDQKMLGASVHGLVGGVSVIHVEAEHGVDVDQLGAARDLVVDVKPVLHALGRLAERALQSHRLGDGGLKLDKRRFPCLVRGKNVRKVPRVALGDVLARLECHNGNTFFPVRFKGG